MSIVGNIEKFIEQHSDALNVQHGEALAQADVKATLKECKVAMPAPLRAVIEKWGYLELSLSSEVWPHSTFNDGLRFFGFGKSVPDRLSLQVQAERYRTRFRKIKADAKQYGDTPSLPNNNFKNMEKRSPVFSTLEGLSHSWCSNSRTLGWFHDFAHYSIRGGILPKDNPLFELSSSQDVLDVLLSRLEYRIKRGRTLRSMQSTLEELGEVKVRGDQHLWCSAMPDVWWHVWQCEGEPTVRAIRRVGFLNLGQAQSPSLDNGVWALRGYPEGDQGSPVEASLGLNPNTELGTPLLKDIDRALAHADAKIRAADCALPYPDQNLTRLTLSKQQLENTHQPTSWVDKG